MFDTLAFRAKRQTFEFHPGLVCQLFIIHAFHQDMLASIVYWFMTDKRRQSYDAIFSQPKDEATQPGLNLKTASILSDFESDLIAAISIAFPISRHRGFYFHFTKAIFRQIQALRSATAYSAVTDVRLRVRQQRSRSSANVPPTFATSEGEMNTIIAPVRLLPTTVAHVCSNLNLECLWRRQARIIAKVGTVV